MHQLSTYAFIWVMCIAYDAAAQFVEVPDALGVEYVLQGAFSGSGVSFYDFDHDGWDDLSLSTGNQTPYFLHNNEGTFEWADFTIPTLSDANILMLLWVDYDNDGDSDLLITKEYKPLELWQNDGAMNFTNVAVSAGLDQSYHNYWGAAFCDYDHDGWLDLFIAKYYNPVPYPGSQYRSILYHSNGDGTFTNTTLAAGIDLAPRMTFQPVFFDYNGDGWEDLYLVNDRYAYQNELYQNNGNGTFTNVSVATGANVSIDAMCGSVADYDNDSDFDLYVTNSILGNKLLTNNGNSTFTSSAINAGVDVNKNCWGGMFIDYNNDTWQDLFVAVVAPSSAPIRNQYFRNDGDGTFTEVADELGLSEDLTQTFVLAKGDLNNDGFMDFMVNSKPPYESKLYMNTADSNNYFALTLEGVYSNRDGIGTRVECYLEQDKYVQQTHCGENYISQYSSKVLYGLGSSTSVDSLVINWTSGIVDRYYDLPANQVMHFVEGQSLVQPFDITSSTQTLVCPGDSVLLDAGSYEAYAWSTGDTTQTITVSSPGQYFVVVTNEWNMEIESNPVEVEFQESAIVLPEITPISCHGSGDGAIEIFLENASLNSILWNTQSQSSTIADLPAGTYQYTLEYGPGCFASGEIVLDNPAPIEAVPTTTDALCFGESSGTVSVELSGGTPQYTIDWQWLNPGALSGGEYNVQGTDENGCEFEFFFTVGEPAPLENDVIVQDVLCHGLATGTATVETSGGTPGYFVDWQFADPNALAAGQYVIVVSDAAGCVSQVSFSIQEPELLEISLETTNAVENGPGGTAELEIEGGVAPYEISWSSGSLNTMSLDDLDPGNYSVTVSDLNTCAISEEFVIDQVNVITALGNSGTMVFPNPSHQWLQLGEIGDSGAPVVLRIFSSSGQLMYLDQAYVYGKTIDVINFPNGMYCIAADSGLSLIRRTFVVMHP